MTLYDEEETVIRRQGSALKEEATLTATPGARSEVAPEISLFLPVLNEEPNLRPLHAKIDEALATLSRTA
ncbi:MAG TPA: hypothetical protein VF754_08510, partial [Pyrinomonadaceae bacterium]